jgi:putative Mg2+ transporter-C (MgtC) family protein
MDLGWLDLVTRLAVTAALGGLIGFERELIGQPAGFRTHVLVAIGAATFTLAGASVVVRGVDPTRVAAQVVTGIGFIGGGAILRHGERVQGITTAASLWLTAAVGLAVGLGDIRSGLLATAIGLATLVALRWIEHGWLPARRTFTVVLELSAGYSLSEAVEGLTRVVGPLEVQEVQNVGAGTQRLVARARLSRELAVVDVGERLRALDGVVGVDMRR